MACKPNTVHWSQYFTKLFDKVLDSYPQSKEDVRKLIDNLPISFEQGKNYPGIIPQVRKMRLPLKAYTIGTSNGLRLIFMAIKPLFLPVFLYKKGKYQENEVVKMLKVAQKAILEELRDKK